jgi:hypothetical protein
MGNVDTTDPKLAIRYQVSDSLGIRGSWGSSFQAPSVRQMSVSSQSSIIDDPASINPTTGQLECNDTRCYQHCNYNNSRRRLS